MTKQKSSYDIKRDIFHLIQQESAFWGEISLRIDKRRNFSIPTAGVMFNEKTFNFELLYNPNFMEKLPDNHKLGVVKHEFWHIILDHCTHRLADHSKEKHQLKNIAFDLAINSFLEGELPENCCFPGKGKFADMPPKMTAEWYFSELNKNPEKYENQSGGGQGQGEEGEGEEGQGQGNSNGQFDDHSRWNGNGSGKGKEMSEEARAAAAEMKTAARIKAREIISKAAQAANKSGNGWGNISQEMQKQISDLWANNQVNWKMMLKSFIKKSIKSKKRPRVLKLNKRYSYIHPGKLSTKTAKLAICIDQSGSVGDKLLQTFFAELNHLSKLATFTVIPFDHEVQEDKIYTWKKGEKKNWERVSCGGTEYNAPTNYINEHKNEFDGAIFLTDFLAPKPGPMTHGIRRMWITNEEGANNPYFTTNEIVIQIDAPNTY